MLTEIGYGPVEAFRRLRHLPHVAFLDSSRFHPVHGRHSFLAADPLLTLRAQGGQTEIGAGLLVAGDPWEVLDALLSRFRLPPDPEVHPFPLGAALGFLSYDAGRWLDRVPSPLPAPIPGPDLWFGFYDVLLAFDHLEKRAWIVSSGLDATGVASNSRAAFRTDQFLDELQSDITLFPSPATIVPQIAATRSRAEHEAAIRKALDYIRQGDIYQVNLAHAFVGQAGGLPQDLYLQLREANPAPFSAYLDHGDGQILSSSPERFLKMRRRLIQTRPIKGTCSRAGHAELDWKQAEALLQSPKNRAELLMITDLLRNDLGKVAEFGSVTVSDLATCEEYETVYHLVSTVEARLRPHVLHLDALAACFPGGSITGAPKIRAMEILRELEPVGRGAYTGALGYIGFNGVSDFNILIRTLVHREGQVAFHVGGGIVADSDPAEEYEETLHKARGLLKLWPDSRTLTAARPSVTA